MAFVLDASITLAWHFDDEGGEAADGIAARADREGVVVPHHWRAEVANGLLMSERRGRTRHERIEVFVERLELLPLTTDDHGADDVFASVLPLAREHRLTIYDAMYLELALRRSLPLASFDADLNAAAERAGVALLGVA